GGDEGPPFSSSPPSPGSCSLRSVRLRVRDLGLGYPSDETLVFRYCGGGCPTPPNNHRLALKALKLLGGGSEGEGNW
ncbi:PSPN protein, partial [Urocolius indicus]|nr:PSPN protein [Urocolius indicus]